MKEPKYREGDRVHIDGTSGIGTVVLREVVAGKYMYHVEYTRYEAKDGAFRPSTLRKQCYEGAIVLVDGGER